MQYLGEPGFAVIPAALNSRMAGPAGIQAGFAQSEMNFRSRGNDIVGSFQASSRLVELEIQFDHDAGGIDRE
ncbi:MAG: hypothetical protein ABI870_11470, partial [Rhodanobacter sp.]